MSGSPYIRLHQLGFKSLAEARAKLDSVRDEGGLECQNGHLECAATVGGRCLGEVWAIVANAEEAE